MNYEEVYSSTFSKEEYSSGSDHFRFDYVTQKINTPSFSLIDVGSGRGQVLFKLCKKFPVAKLTAVDLENFSKFPNFIKCDLSKIDSRNNLLNEKYDYLSSTDLLEHLDKSFIDDVVCLFSKLADTCLISVANHSDVINGIELHTIQENDIWWDAIFSRYFTILDKQISSCGFIYMYTLKPIV
jgi:hypothetical protein